MSRFHIDDPEIDVADLEARVQDAIARKLGKRFTEADLEALRGAELEPALRREDLPRGLPGEISEVRARLPEIGPSPQPEGVVRARSELGREPPGHPPFVSALEAPPPATGLRGRLKAVVSRLLRRSLVATLNLESVIVALQRRQDVMADQLANRDDVYFDHLESGSERAADQLKDNLDGRIDRTADWMGSHLSQTSGQLDRGSERQLQLLHNLVYEITNMRLNLRHLEHRINETGERLSRLEQRERTLERLSLGREPGE